MLVRVRMRVRVRRVRALTFETHCAKFLFATALRQLKLPSASPPHHRRVRRHNWPSRCRLFLTVSEALIMPIIPSCLPVVNPFYAVGNTPAVSLTRCLPQDVDASILLLGCGDVRHILYTAYTEKGLREYLLPWIASHRSSANRETALRKLDITCCDIDDAIIARNVLLLTLIIDDNKTVDSQALWAIYYDLYLDDASTHLLREHITTLLQHTGSLEEWGRSPFGTVIRFSDHATLVSARTMWTKYAEAMSTKEINRYHDSLKSARTKEKKYKEDNWGKFFIPSGGARAGAPCGSRTWGDPELAAATNRYWETGVTGILAKETTTPNPLFAVTLTGNRVLLYGGDAIFCYHLATTQASLTEMSPLRLEDTSGKSKVTQAAQVQFREWTKAFQDLASKNFVLRFIAGDCFALCHTLEHNIATGATSAHFYRRQLCMEPLKLDDVQYGKNGNAPNQFDVIDTSNLSDYFGALNLLVSATPLLRDMPWATLYTETMEKGTNDEKKKFADLLGGHTITVSTLLGISPIEYWTNATAVSSVDEYLLAESSAIFSPQQDKSGIQWRFAWKSNHHISGQPFHQRLRAEPDMLANAIFAVYQSMFENENVMALMSLFRQQKTKRVGTLSKYHRGSLVALIKRLSSKVDTDVANVCQQIIGQIATDSSRMLGTNHVQALCLDLHRQELYTEVWINSMQRDSSKEGFSAWSQIPAAVAVTLVIPPAQWKRVYDVALAKDAGFIVEGSLRAMNKTVALWHNIYPDVQITFGTLTSEGKPEEDSFSVTVEEDKSAWPGKSPMIASFYAPAAALQVDMEKIKVALCLEHSVQNTAIYNAQLNLGSPMSIYETGLEDRQHVFITKHQPNHQGHHVFPSRSESSNRGVSQSTTVSSNFSVDIGKAGDLKSITGHLDVVSSEGKKLLADKTTAVDVRKISASAFEIVLGKRKEVYNLNFPVPVVKDGSKTRIARTSGYVEIIAPLADPATAQSLDNFIFPITLAKLPLSAGSRSLTIPVTLNIPHLNLDSLPIVDISDKQRLEFMTQLTSMTFSHRERRMRDKLAEERGGGLSTSARLNFKESLFTMFMLSSGLQGGQTGLFAITQPDNGGIHMLIIVSALRLDGANASIALDAAAIPYTTNNLKSGEMDPFLLIMRELEICSVTVNDEELVLWKKVLPALVERCRTWSHTPGCEYARDGAKIPLSTKFGEQVLCSCGMGKIPDNFISVPEWDTASRFATRVAISPTYAVPFVEQVMDPDFAKKNAAAAAAAGGLGLLGDTTATKCRNCGKTEAKGGGVLKKCSRCGKTRYCSAECQKTDWKKHRGECGESKV